jgi:hypothetical protein
VIIPNRYIERIQAFYPNLSLDYLEFNQDGMNNDVVVVNRQLVCRFSKTDWAKESLKSKGHIYRFIGIHGVNSFIDVLGESKERNNPLLAIDAGFTI